MIAVEDQTCANYPIRTRSCRSFDISVPSHPVLLGALLVCRNDARLHTASSGWVISAATLRRR
jgi:hypothetical protein